MASTVKKARSLDEKYMGFEPEWKDYRFLSEEELNEKIETSLQWYSHFYDLKQSISFIQKYLKKNKVDDKAVSVLTLEDSLKIGRTLGFLCKIKLKGLDQLPEKYNKIFVEKMTLLNQLAKARKIIKQKVKDKTDADKVTISVRDRINTLAKGLVFDIEYYNLQDYIDSKYDKTFDAVSFCKINNIKTPTAKIMKDLLSRSKEEIELSKIDNELKEAYSNFSVREKNKLIKFYDTTIKEIDQYLKRNVTKKK